MVASKMATYQNDPWSWRPHKPHILFTCNSLHSIKCTC